MGVNSLPKTVTRQRRDCDLNPGPTAPESSTLTTRLPSHPLHKLILILLQVPALSGKIAGRRCCCRSTEQTDGRRDGRTQGFSEGKITNAQNSSFPLPIFLFPSLLPPFPLSPSPSFLPSCSPLVPSPFSFLSYSPFPFHPFLFSLPLPPFPLPQIQSGLGGRLLARSTLHRIAVNCNCTSYN